LSAVMQQISGVYTQRFNLRYHRDGPLFRGRYKSILVETGRYQAELVRYIHLQKVRTGQFKKPEDDKYCSHRFYLGLDPVPSWLVVQDVLDGFGGGKGDARMEFDTYVCAGIPEDIEKKLDRDRWPAILGQQKFLEVVRENYMRGSTKKLRKQRAKVDEITYTPGEIVRAICDYYGVQSEQVTSRSSGRSNEARRVAMYMLRNLCRLSYGKIGEILGGVGYGAVAPVYLQMKREAGKWSRIQGRIRKTI